MSSSKVTQKGQVTIPKAIRERLGVREGQKVIFVIRGEDVILKVLQGNILDLKGSVKAHRLPEDFEGIRRSVKKAVGLRLGSRE